MLEPVVTRATRSFHSFTCVLVSACVFCLCLSWQRTRPVPRAAARNHRGHNRQHASPRTAKQVSRALKGKRTQVVKLSRSGEGTCSGRPCGSGKAASASTSSEGAARPPSLRVGLQAGSVCSFRCSLCRSSSRRCSSSAKDSTAVATAGVAPLCAAARIIETAKTREGVFFKLKNNARFTAAV